MLDVKDHQKLVVKDITDMSHIGKQSQHSSLAQYFIDDSGSAIRMKCSNSVYDSRNLGRYLNSSRSSQPLLLGRYASSMLSCDTQPVRRNQSIISGWTKLDMIMRHGRNHESMKDDAISMQIETSRK